jgi:hypothetical protein
VLRFGRADLPDEGDEQLRSKYLQELQVFREQYLPLIGKPFMPPKRFSAAEMPYETEGVGYWSVAEAVVLDDLLRNKQYENAAKHLLRTIEFSQQLASYGDFSASLMGGFMWVRSIMIIENHFENIPARHAALFRRTLQTGLLLARPLSETIDADEAAQLLDIDRVHRDADLVLRADFNFRHVARETKLKYESLRKQMESPIAKRQIPDESDTYDDLFFVGGDLLYAAQLTLIRTRLLVVGLAVREHRFQTGQFPVDLDELDLGDLILDPYTGDQLVYKTGSDEFLLYARGIDGDDDGGQRAWRSRYDGDIGVISPKRGEADTKSFAPPVWLK